MKNDWKNIFFTLFTTLLCFGFGWGQTTSLSGTTITMTGTHTDLSGLASISGVTTTTIAGKTYYILEDLQLIVEGTLSLNPENEQLIFTTASLGTNVTTNKFVIQNSGVFNYGVSTTQNNKTAYTDGVGLVFNYNGSGGNDNYDTRDSGGLVVINGGTFNAYGGTIKTDMPIGFGKALITDSTGDVSGAIEKLKVIDTHSTEGIQFRLDLDTNGANQLAVNDLTLGDGMDFLVGNQAPTTPIGLTLEDATIRHTFRQKDSVEFKNLSLANNAASQDFNIGAASGENPDLTSVNTDVGSAIRTNSGLGESSIINFLASKELQFLITDDSGGGLESFIYIEGSQSPTIVSTGTNGELSNAEEITLMTIIKANTDTTETLTRYSLDGTDNDVFRFYLFSYGKLSASFTDDLKGNGVKTIPRLLFDDPNISQTNKSIVDAYNEIETLDKFYDRAAAWKVDNVAAEYPAIDSPLITVVGSTLDLGSQNLIVDANASQAFVVDTSTNTITLKANSLTVGNGDYTSITTTGNISAQNGGEILFGYEDSNGKNIFVDFNWGTSDTYHVNIVDLNDNTVIATHNNQSNNYSGTFVAPTPFGSGAKIQLLITGDNSVFYEANFTDENTLTFARTSGSINDISTETTGVAQHEALFLARKILQKTESMAAALEGTTPTLADDTTTITEASSTVATKENQEAIRALLLRILTKTSASYEALKGAE